MAKEEVELKKTDSILEAINQLHKVISQRAYDLFRDNQGLLAGPLDNWLRAERELVWCPAVELRQKDGQIELAAAVAGMEPKDLDVQVTPEDILISGTADHRHEAGEGTVHLCEFQGGRLFRSIHLPERIDPDSARAEYRNGMLRLTVAVAKPESRKVDVQAA